MASKKHEGARLPYFKMFPADWLSSATVSALTGEEEGAFVRLLCLSWTSDGLPECLDELRKLTKISQFSWRKSKNVFDFLFPLSADGRRRNLRQEEERKAVEDSHLRRAEAGRLSVAKRWQRDSKPISNAIASDTYTQKADTQSSKDNVSKLPSPLLPTAAIMHTDQHERVEGDRRHDTTFTKTTRLLTAAANKGISERYGEQPVPITASSSGSYRCAEVLTAAGVAIDFAANAIFECAKLLQLDKPPRSLGYFVQHVLDRWNAQSAHSDAASFTPSAAPSSGRPAEGDQLRYAAMRYAQEGSAEWQAYCAERNIVWQEKTA